MFYFWFIPLAIALALLVWGIFLRFRRRARRAAGDEQKSPLDEAKEMELREERAARGHKP